MKGYKSSETRLIYLFKDGREKWKEKAKQLEASLKEQEAEIEALKKKIANREMNQE